MVKTLPASAEVVKDMGSFSGSGRSPEGGYGHPLQCSFLKNDMDRGSCESVVHGVTKSRTWLK